MKLPGLVWDKWNKEHIKKHKVTVIEAEEAYVLSQVISKGQRGRVFIISKIRNGRMITVFLSYEKQKRPYVVSARDSSVTERRLYYEKYQ